MKNTKVVMLRVNEELTVSDMLLELANELHSVGIVAVDKNEFPLTYLVRLGEIDIAIEDYEPLDEHAEVFFKCKHRITEIVHQLVWDIQNPERGKYVVVGATHS
ncbi:hypothetical protein RGU76_04610 [Bacillus pseudomycoides]|uniref:hypothetical protein n=1 Tax=Bacillus TaxID=1386 RepID=UPI002248C100|nr:MULTISPECIES: hypothetical protein [Bacillus]MCX2826566.1 hypothetical protein [Bacillus sp. DHT2]MDR4914413.1 hypothetical protein [Bacillus pseudomycoides]